MKKKFILLILFVTFSNYTLVNATNTSVSNYSELYKEWLSLDEDYRKNIPEPPKFVKEFIPKVTFYNNFEPFAEMGAIGNDTYDLRNVEGKNFITNVKDQGSTNLCWSFASSGSIESNLLINDLGHYDFNPFHTSNALAFSFSDYYNPYGSKEINTGGNFDDSLKYWTSGIGPVTDFSGDGVNTLSASNTLVNTSPIQIKEAYRLPYFDLNSQNDEAHIQFINLIKQQIIENGALEFYSASPQSAEGNTLTLNDGTTYNCTNPYNESHYSVYTDNENDYLCSAHAMLIVGWDDNFSKNNFNVGSETNALPSKDGAWIVKNSWGDGYYDLDERIDYVKKLAANQGMNNFDDEDAIYNLEKWGYVIDENNNTAYLENNGGYVYYSYEDYNLNRWIEVVSDTKVIDYDNIYQYNPTGDSFWFSSSYVGGGIIFDKTKDIEILNEISMYLIPTNSNNYVNYQVYINSKDGNLENMELITSGKIENNYSGYYTIDLNQNIELTGEQFAVKVILENATIGITRKINSNFSNKESLGIIKNQSYMYYNSTSHTDLYNSDESVFIKAFTTKKDINVTKTKKVNTVLKNTTIEYPINNQKITIKSITNNISDGTLLTYKIYDSNNNEVTNKFNLENGLIISNLGISILNLNSNINEDLYTIETIYEGEVLDTDLLDLRSQYIEIKNIENQEIYSKKGGTLSATINTVGVNDDIITTIKNSKGEDVTNLFSIKDNINENEINLEVEVPKNTQYDIYTVEFSTGAEILMGVEFTVYNLIIKYNDSALNNLKLLKNDTIEVIPEVLPSNSNLNVTLRVEDTTKANINNNIVNGINSGDTNVVATINNETIKLPLTILDEPYFIYETFNVLSNVKGNEELDNFFGGNVEAVAEYYNVNNDMTIEKTIVNENNIVSECFNTAFIDDLEGNKININIETKENCLENKTIISGIYKVSLKININDTKNSTITNFRNIEINDYIPITNITSNINKLNLKTDDIYNLNEIDLLLEPSTATNKNIKYVEYNEEIISINEDGTITALKAGITTIKVMSVYNENIYDTINVMVNPNINEIKEEDIRIDSNYNGVLYAGFGGRIIANITTENILDNERLTINYYKDGIKQNDMSNILDLTGNNILNNSATLNLYIPSSLEKGKYKIELNYENALSRSFEFDVVEQKKVTSIEADDIVLSNDETYYNINYKINPSDAFNKKVEFEIADTTVATVNDKGQIKGLKVGNTTLTIKATDGSNIEKTVNVSVVEKSIVISNVKLENDIIYETIGGKINFRISLINIDSKKVNLSILNNSNETVYNEEITLNEKGYKDVEINLPKSIISGTYTIKVTNGSFNNSATFEITSYKEVENLKFLYKENELNNLILLKEKEVKITSLITNDDATFKDVTYSIKDTTIARLTDEGLIYGIKSGKTELIASVGNQIFKLPIEIIESNSRVSESVHQSNISNEFVDVKYGGTITNIIEFNNIKENSNFNVEVFDGDKLLDRDILERDVFLLNNIAATITLNIKPNKLHEYTPSKELTVKYSYTLNDVDSTEVTKEYKVNIKEYNPITKINLSNTNIKLDINETISIRSIFHFEPSNATNYKVSLSSSNTNVAITDGYDIKALSEGTAKITVTSLDNENIKSTINVTVEKNDYLEFKNNIKIYNENGSKYLKGLLGNNTYKDLTRNINTNLNIVLRDSEGVKVKDNLTILKTGMKLTIGDYKYDIVIKGDMSGDGKVSITDLSQMRYHLAGVKGKTKKGSYKVAGDLNDKDGLTITDLSQMRKKLAGVNQ